MVFNGSASTNPSDFVISDGNGHSGPAFFIFVTEDGTISGWNPNVPPPLEKLVRFLDLDRRRGFDLSRAPLWRLTLIRLSKDEWQLVWTFHHAILDGRSYALLLREIFQVHDNMRLGHSPGPRVPEARPYRDYIDWVGRQDFDRSALAVVD